MWLLILLNNSSELICEEPSGKTEEEESHGPEKSSQSVANGPEAVGCGM